ncbi:hypothetical protein ACKWTF_001506 [Chironomus riparius]
MDFDWETVRFDFNLEENHFTSHDLYVPESNQSVDQQPQQNIQPVKRSREEMEQDEVFVFEVPVKSDDMNKSVVSIAYQVPHSPEEIKYEDSNDFNPDDLIEEEIFEDDEDVKYPQQENHIEYKNASGDIIYYCESCSLDFPSIAYLRRHQNTKKHQRALGMERRGKKVNQKRKYVRKNEVKPGLSFNVKQEVRKITDIFQVKQEVKRVPQVVKQEVIRIPQVVKQEVMTSPWYNQSDVRQDVSSITELTQEDIEILHAIDDQIFMLESEKTAKDFYENFNFDDDDTPIEKVKQFSTVEDILTDLIASSEPFFKNMPSNVVPKSQAIKQVPQFSEPMVQVPHFSRPIVQAQPLVYVKPAVHIQHQQRILQQPAQMMIKEEQPKSKIQCQMCPRTFNLRCHLTQHMNIVHTGNRNFKCTKCGKKYQSQELLNHHMEKHLGDKPFRCSKCVKSYNNKVDLKRHFKTHEEIKDHICKICGGGFVRSDHLEKHLIIHQKHNRVELGDRIRIRKGLPTKNVIC